MANPLEEEIRREMRHLQIAKERLQSAVTVYVEPVLRDAAVFLQLPMTDERKYRENMAALREYRDICYEMEDVLRHKCGDASSISIDDLPQQRREDSRISDISGLVIENESEKETIIRDVDSSDVNALNAIDVPATTYTDDDDSSTGSTSVLTVINSSIQESSVMDNHETLTQEADEKSVNSAMAALENLDASLRSNRSSDSSFQPDQRADSSLQANETFHASLVQSEEGEGSDTGNMFMKAKFGFIPDDIFGSTDDSLSARSKRDGQWTLIDNPGEWQLHNFLDCFFPKHPAHLVVEINWQQMGAGILMISAGVIDRRSLRMRQFPYAPATDRTFNDGETGQKLFKCFLSSNTGLWVSIHCLSFNPKLTYCTLTCQRCPESELTNGASVSRGLPFYEYDYS